ncbi:F-BAR and double SH3 domains protein 1-like protein [Lates japonicus]|uniref:F-BAR and double SH3 domains protein 1-like protein n=1 Tax=Lates japonicus TaxID=270547 RepID=A0AAD3QW93_LATJO|nr:F-BAR and double SH3 domains protein 1-like protein [Lates japonicus]
MGLCTSKSTVTLDPSAHTLSADRTSQAAGEGVSPEGTPILDEGILMVQPVKSKAEGGGGGGGGTKSVGLVNQTAKGYLELGGKGGEGEAQTSREAEEEDEDEDGDEVEELINFSDSEGSLRSEFLE